MSATGALFLLSLAMLLGGRQIAPTVKVRIQRRLGYLVRRAREWWARDGDHRADGRPLLFNLQPARRIHREPTIWDELDPEFMLRAQLREGGDW